MSEPLPGYRVTARNTSAHGENPIHRDDVARRYGFKGGLVPGVTVYAYLSHALLAGLGAAWLTRGTASVRFVRPVLEGEEVRVSGEVTTRDAKGVAARACATTTETGECAVLTASVPAGLPTPVNVALYPAAPLPAERPAVSRRHLESLGALGTPETTYDDERATSYLDSIGETLAVFRGRGGWVHPAFYLDQANRAVDRNVRLGPWIHVTSTVRHLGGAHVGDRLETRGRLRSLYERHGREYAELDLVVLAGAPARPAAHVLHTVIYQLPPA